MEIPNLLRIGWEKLAEGSKVAQLKAASASLTEKYQTESGQGKRLVTTEAEATAYALVRMPATYGAVYSALQYALENYEGTIESVLDAGAGTGAGAWAVSELLADELPITCLEREAAMMTVGRKLAAGNPLLGGMRWVQTDVTAEECRGTYDLVIASYALNELSEPERMRVLQMLWKAANKILVIVEPGTPAAFQQMRAIRTAMLQTGANLAAPCPHRNACLIAENDWCHFTCRVPRSKLHQQLKGAEVPYEDEKFSYLAFTKAPSAHCAARVLRHPVIEAGCVRLTLCTQTEIAVKTYTKKSGSLFKAARKASCGDAFEEN